MKRPRPSPPEPWPADTQPNGALYGDLPLLVPRPTPKSNKVTIIERKDGVTTYQICKSTETASFRIDTHNESLLRLGLSFQKYGNKRRVLAAGKPLARLIASKFPSPDPDRIIVDHANRDTTNDCEGNLHWVTPEFNSFNTARDEKREGYIGVNQNGVSSTVYHAGRIHGIYTNARTAARVYDLVCTIHYGDQLNKTKDLLNNLPNPKSTS